MPGETERFSDVFALDSKHVWAEGREGKIWYFDGVSWSEQFNADQPVMDIYGTDPSEIWAIGTDIEPKDDLMRSHWHPHHFDGESWEMEYRSPWEEEDLTSVDFMDQVTAIDDKSLWVGGRAIFHGRKKQ